MFRVLCRSTTQPNLPHQAMNDGSKVYEHNRHSQGFYCSQPPVCAHAAKRATDDLSDEERLKQSVEIGGCTANVRNVNDASVSQRLFLRA